MHNPHPCWNKHTGRGTETSTSPAARQLCSRAAVCVLRGWARQQGWTDGTRLTPSRPRVPPCRRSCISRLHSEAAPSSSVRTKRVQAMHQPRAQQGRAMGHEQHWQDGAAQPGLSNLLCACAKPQGSGASSHCHGSAFLFHFSPATHRFCSTTSSSGMPLLRQAASSDPADAPPTLTRSARKGQGLASAGQICSCGALSARDHQACRRITGKASATGNERTAEPSTCQHAAVDQRAGHTNVVREQATAGRKAKAQVAVSHGLRGSGKPRQLTGNAGAAAAMDPACGGTCPQLMPPQTQHPPCAHPPCARHRPQ